MFLQNAISDHVINTWNMFKLYFSIKYEYVIPTSLRIGPGLREYCEYWHL